MKKKRYVLIFMALILLTGYSYWNYVYVHTPAEALAKANISYGTILHEVRLDDGLLMFYRHPYNQEEICLAYEVRAPWSGWKHVGGGGAAVNSQMEDLSWCWSRIKEEESDGSSKDSDYLLGVLFGEINNPAISSIKVKANINTKLTETTEPLIEEEAQIVKCPDTNLWYVIANRDMATAMKIYAYSDKGELIDIANDWGHEMDAVLEQRSHGD